jgi:hypothetical protein
MTWPERTVQKPIGASLIMDEPYHIKFHLDEEAYKYFTALSKEIDSAPELANLSLLHKCACEAVMKGDRGGVFDPFTGQTVDPSSASINCILWEISVHPVPPRQGASLHIDGQPNDMVRSSPVERGLTCSMVPGFASASMARGAGSTTCSSSDCGAASSTRISIAGLRERAND